MEHQCKQLKLAYFNVFSFPLDQSRPVSKQLRAIPPIAFHFTFHTLNIPSRNPDTVYGLPFRPDTLGMRKTNAIKANRPSSARSVTLKAAQIAAQKTSVFTHIVLAAFASACVFSLWAVSRGWQNPLLDFHKFRQTQTAISTYYMLGRLPMLAYETPVLGEPWIIPMEFPLYQWIVAGIVNLFGTALDQTGRFVSCLFFYGCVGPIYYLLGALRVEKKYRLLPISLFLASPFYVYWSRCFLIESTALFFSLSFLTLFVAHRDRGKAVYYWLAVLSGALACAVKLPTAFPCFIAAVAMGAPPYLADWKTTATLKEKLSFLGRLTALMGVPLLAGIAWTAYSDSFKEKNVLGAYNTSKGLMTWNFGTLEQRLTTGTWTVIFERCPYAIGSFFFVIAAAIIVFSVKRRRNEFCTCLALYLSAPLVFTNLYFIHEYYAFATNVFLLGAVGFSIVALMEGHTLQKRFSLGFAFLILGTMAYQFQSYYSRFMVPGFGESQAKAMEMLGTRIRPEETMIVIGHDWEPDIAYYAKRRMLMIPDWKDISVNRWPEFVKASRKESFGGVLIFKQSKYFMTEKGAIQDLINYVGVNPKPEIDNDGLLFYVRRSEAIP